MGFAGMRISRKRLGRFRSNLVHMFNTIGRLCTWLFLTVRSKMAAGQPSFFLSFMAKAIATAWLDQYCSNLMQGPRSITMMCLWGQRSLEGHLKFWPSIWCLSHCFCLAWPILFQLDGGEGARLGEWLWFVFEVKGHLKVTLNFGSVFGRNYFHCQGREGRCAALAGLTSPSQNLDIFISMQMRSTWRAKNFVAARSRD